MPSTTGNPAVIPPTVGRIVLFRKDETNTFPAIITRIHEGTGANGVPLINLMVFADFISEAMTSVYHGENVEQWDWMPYMKDQAQREREEIETPDEGPVNETE